MNFPVDNSQNVSAEVCGKAYPAVGRLRGVSSNFMPEFGLELCKRPIRGGLIDLSLELGKNVGCFAKPLGLAVILVAG